MKRNSNFFVNSTHKTKTWWTFVSVLVLVFVPFLILWLLACEFNLLDTNWLIAKNSSVWHGVVTYDNIDILANKYAVLYSPAENAVELLKSNLTSYIDSGKQASIIAYKTFFNPVVLAPLFGLLLFAIGYPIIFNATKVSGLDVLPFSAGIGMLMFSMILSGLIPQWGQSMLVIYWIVRIIIAFLIAAIAFIISNKLVNRFLAGRSYATDIYFGYKINDASTKHTREQLKENVDTFKHNSDNDKDYVEIEQEDK